MKWTSNAVLLGDFLRDNFKDRNYVDVFKLLRKHGLLKRDEGINQLPWPTVVTESGSQWMYGSSANGLYVYKNKVKAFKILILTLEE